MSITIQMTRTQDAIAAQDLFNQPHWYAGYTSSRHEKSVAAQLALRSVEHFLPLYETTHRWKNGRHRVQLPLFPGYIFVRIPLANRLRVLEVAGFVRLVAFQGMPLPLPESDLETMRAALRGGLAAEPHPYLVEGTRVEICGGPLQGMRGTLLRRHGRVRVVVTIDLIQRAMIADVDVRDIVPLREPATSQLLRT